MIKYFKIMLIMLLASQVIECSDWNKNIPAKISLAGVGVLIGLGGGCCNINSPYNTPFGFVLSGILMGLKPLSQTSWCPKFFPNLKENPNAGDFHYLITIGLLSGTLLSFACNN